MQLKFAEIIISLTADPPDLVFDVPKVFAPFLTNGQPDIDLIVRMGLPSFSDSAALVFHTDGNWSLYQENGRYVIPVCFPPGAEPRLIAKMESDFRSGEIIVDDNRKIRSPFFPLEYPLGELLFINLLARGRGVLLHACAVNDGGKGLLFTGTSGAGKSTTANLWQNIPGVTLLSDDRVILRLRNNRFWIYGTPWHGDARAASPEGVPLERIFILKHASRNFATPLDPQDAVSSVLVRTFPTFWDADGMAFTLQFLTDLAETISCYELGFVPDHSMVDFVRGTASDLKAKSDE